MTSEKYPVETLDEDHDNGTMPDNVDTLAKAVIGHRIVSAAKETVKAKYPWGGSEYETEAFVITLDTGRKVKLHDGGDCCAYTGLEDFLLHADRIDHVITGIGTTDEYEKWHIYADLGDVLELTVGWSCGNPFYYGYGFDIVVEDAA